MVQVYKTVLDPFQGFLDLPIIAMPSYVILAVCVVVESLSASIGAFERLLTSMDSHVNFQIRSVFESFTATRMWALMHLLASVYPVMIFELTCVLRDPLTATLWVI